MVEKKKSPRGSAFWQITFPALVGTLLVLALGIWFGLTGSDGSISRFAEISTVLLAIPVYLFSLLIGLLLVGLVYLVGRLIQGIPPMTDRLVTILEKVQDGAKQGSRSLARLVIEPAAMLAIFQRKRGKPDPEIRLND